LSNTYATKNPTNISTTPPKGTWQKPQEFLTPTVEK